MGSRKASATKQVYEKHPFQLSVDDLKSQLGTNIESGLSSRQIGELQQKYGENKLSGEGGVKWYTILLKQISNAMLLVRSPTTSSLNLAMGRVSPVSN